jgi:hypothetical protein
MSNVYKMGKETIITGAFNQAVKMANKGNPKLEKKLRPIFKDETPQVIQDFKNKKMSDNVKTYLLLEIMDVQPVGLSETPEAALRGGNTKIFYMLKRFYIKQLDTVIRTTVDDMKSAKGFKEKSIQVGRIARLYGALIALDVFAATQLKSLLYDREYQASDKFKKIFTGDDLYKDIMDFLSDDHMVDSYLKLVSWSKFHSWKLREEGPLSAAVRQVIPPAKLPEAITRDIWKTYKGDFEWMNAESFNSIPIGGKLWYWWYGKGAEKTEKRRKKHVFEELSDLRKIEQNIKENPAKALELRKKHPKLRNIKRLEALNKRWNEIQKLIDSTDDKEKIEKYKKMQELIAEKVKSL